MRKVSRQPRYVADEMTAPMVLEAIGTRGGTAILNRVVRTQLSHEIGLLPGEVEIVHFHLQDVLAELFTEPLADADRCIESRKVN